VVIAGGVLGIALLPSLPLVVAAGGTLAIAGGAFQATSWAALTDTVPEGEGASFLAVANIATAAASAATGLLGPVVDGFAEFSPRAGYQVAFAVAALATLASLAPLARLRTIDGPPGKTRAAEPRVLVRRPGSRPG
jgi:MFS family permease